MKKYFFLLLLLPYYCFSQINYKLITTIAVPSDYFTTDNQANVYVVKGNTLTKYDKTGKELYKYSNKNFGNITFVDASNMLRILLFYKDFLQIVFLDNTLSLNGEPVSLDKIGFQQAQLVCSSYNSGCWIYDQQNMELIRLDQNLLETQKTGNLSALLNMDLKPDFLIEYNNKVYLNNPTEGILVFDIYGTYNKTIPSKNTTEFQPFTDWTYYMTANKINAYNTKSTEEVQFETPIKDFLSFRLEMGVLILRTENSILLYSSQ